MLGTTAHADPVVVELSDVKTQNIVLEQSTHSPTNPICSSFRTPIEYRKAMVGAN